MKRYVVLLLISSLLVLSSRAAGQDSSLEEARQLNRRALELSSAGRYEAALPLAERALAIMEQARGPAHPDVAIAASNLAELYRLKGDYSRAEPLYLRALAIQERLPGTGQAALATTLSNLAELYKDQGNYARAEPLQHRVLAIREKVFGPEHSSVATTLNNFADLYRSKGDYARAEPLYLRALAIYVKVSGAEHTDVALVLNNLAALYQYKGDYARAEPLYLRALAIREKALGPQHPDVAVTLNNLAECQRARGDLGRAALYLERALAIQLRINPERLDVAIALNNLASLYFLRGDYARAEPLYARALTITANALGPEHPDVARGVNNLAALYAAKGDYARAESGYRRALAIREKVLGPDHPSVAVTLTNLSDLCRSKGDLTCAVQFLQRNLEIRERNLNMVIASGSEDQKQLYINTLSGETSYAVWLHVRLAPTDPKAAQVALTTILRRKGRALDAMTDQIAILRQRASPQDRQMLDQLAVARSQLATLQLSSSALTPEARQAGIARLLAAVAQLEDQVSRRSSEFRSLFQPVTLEAVRQALPADTALVEIASYKSFNPKATRASERFGPPQYVAYVLKRDVATPQFVDLGDAALIDPDIARLRAALQDPKRGDVKALARTMDDRVMKPVRALLGAARHVFISPDGALNLIPFAALVDEGGRYLVEQYMLSYLTTGRDLLRLQLARASRAAPLVMGDPLYDMRTAREQPPVPPQPKELPGQEIANRRSINFAGLSYAPLPGTGQEARALQILLPGARLLLQQQATEAALKQARAPRILHIATHGFFLPDQPANEAADTRAFSHGQEVERTPEKKEQENPLLRSGIVLAGVNQQQSGSGEDGVLTALEASGLDLWGTQLVVLSACETGLGEVRNGQGVYGLRRALLLAGSETQVMSLWSVADEATRDLMVGFYRRLQAGEGRAEALRNVQLEMLGAKIPAQSSDATGALTPAARYSHPYFWAPFIESGAWTTMAAHPR